MSTLAFTDGETTGLESPLRIDHAHVDRMWELAVKVRDHLQPSMNGLWEWQLNVEGTPVHPQAAQVNRFHERYRVPAGVQVLLTGHPDGPVPAYAANGSYAELARTLVELLGGAHWVGAVPDFDTRFILPFLHEHHGPAVTWGNPPWHYHLVDVENLAAGRLQLPPPWDSEDLSRRLGVEPPPPELRHTAAGDVGWVENMYDAVMAADSVPLVAADGTKMFLPAAAPPA